MWAMSSLVRRSLHEGWEQRADGPVQDGVHQLAHGAVDLDHPIGRGARRLVEPVDVLGDERVELAAALEGDEGAMAGIGLGLPGRRLQAALPRALAHLGIGDVVLQRGLLLRLRILGPYALGAAKVGDARVGGDARAREHHDALGRLDPGPDLAHGPPPQPAESPPGPPTMTCSWVTMKGGCPGARKRSRSATAAA